MQIDYPHPNILESIYNVLAFLTGFLPKLTKQIDNKSLKLVLIVSEINL